MPEHEGFDRNLRIAALLLDEIALQAVWAEYHLGLLRDHIAESRKAQKGAGPNWPVFLRERSLAFAEAQAFLTCAAIVDSMLTRGQRPPRDTEPITDDMRSELKRRLGLGLDFSIPGRLQRNGLVHIAERTLRWSKTEGLSGDFLTGIAKETTQEQLSQILRALDFNSLEFAILGEECRLTEVELALTQVRSAADLARKRILNEVNARSTG